METQTQGIWQNLHVPRCGGANDPLVIGGHDAFWKHCKYFGWEEWTAYTVIRDPAERLYSQYRHFSRKTNPMEPISKWLSKEGARRICNCLWCYYGDTAHRSNPMCWFYASRSGEHTPPVDPLEAAKEILEQTQVYHMSQIDDLVFRLAEQTGADPTGYKPYDVTGEGEKVGDDLRLAVREMHQLDCQLYDWAMEERC